MLPGSSHEPLALARWSLKKLNHEACNILWHFWFMVDSAVRFTALWNLGLCLHSHDMVESWLLLVSGMLLIPFSGEVST